MTVDPNDLPVNDIEAGPILCPRCGSRVNPICWRCWVELGGVVYKWSTTEAPAEPKDAEN